MKKIQFSNLELINGGGGNCRGIYESCLNVALVAGFAFIFTPVVGPMLGTLTGYAGMEYCRQQYLGCHWWKNRNKS